MVKTYQDLILLPTFEERFSALAQRGVVGDWTFGGHRYLNQRFYTSPEWRRVRRDVILRDNGCDLAVPGYDILDSVFIHHLDPIRLEDLILKRDWILLPDYLVCCSFSTHNALHYGKKESPARPFADRKPGDTCIWR